MKSKIDEAQLEYWGDMFVNGNYQEQYNIDFNHFVEMMELGTWEQYKESKNALPVITQLTYEEVLEHIDHPDPHIRNLADSWLDLYEEVKERTKERENILGPASSLLTTDSRLKYELEEEM